MPPPARPEFGKALGKAVASAPRGWASGIKASEGVRKGEGARAVGVLGLGRVAAFPGGAVTREGRPLGLPWAGRTGTSKRRPQPRLRGGGGAASTAEAKGVEEGCEAEAGGRAGEAGGSVVGAGNPGNTKGRGLGAANVTGVRAGWVAAGNSDEGCGPRKATGKPFGNRGGRAGAGGANWGADPSGAGTADTAGTAAWEVPGARARCAAERYERAGGVPPGRTPRLKGGGVTPRERRPAARGAIGGAAYATGGTVGAADKSPRKSAASAAGDESGAGRVARPLEGEGWEATRAPASGPSREPRGIRARDDERTLEDREGEAVPWGLWPPGRGRPLEGTMRWAPEASATLPRGAEDAEVTVNVRDREGIAMRWSKTW